MIVWKSDYYKSFNVDSIAVIDNHVLVTSKQKNMILVLDNASGRLISMWEGFNRPNGIVTFDNYVLIIERDNKRIQLFSYPNRKLIDIWGTNILKKPYGGTFKKLVDGYQILITDDLTKSIYSIVYRFKNKSLVREHAYLWKKLNSSSKLESLYYDSNKDLLLVANEEKKIILIYNFKTRELINTVGKRFLTGEPEGISKWNNKYIITNQSKSDNKFYILNGNFDVVKILKIKDVKNTDGIHVSNDNLYVINDDIQIIKYRLSYF